MKKKAQGMPMETIIIAALVIIVLIVLVFIFAGKFNLFGKTTKSCSASGGTCDKASSTEDCPKGYVEIKETNCDDESKKCCMNILVDENAETTAPVSSANQETQTGTQAGSQD